jgi:hypothetical protein
LGLKRVKFDSQTLRPHPTYGLILAVDSFTHEIYLADRKNYDSKVSIGSLVQQVNQVALGVCFIIKWALKVQLKDNLTIQKMFANQLKVSIKYDVKIKPYVTAVILYLSRSEMFSMTFPVHTALP